MDELTYEREYFERGYTAVAGVDEVGRGLWRVPSYAPP